jgi:uncharacterized membrane protein YfcA
MFLPPYSRIQFFIGLFVPISFLSGIAMLLRAMIDPWAILVALVLVIIALFVTDRLARRIIVNPNRRVIAYFIALLAITFFLDLWMYGCWQSMELLINPGPGGGCFRIG